MTNYNFNNPTILFNQYICQSDTQEISISMFFVNYLLGKNQLTYAAIEARAMFTLTVESAVSKSTFLTWFCFR